MQGSLVTKRLKSQHQIVTYNPVISLQVLNRPYEQYLVDAVTVVNEVEVLDVKTVVTGLIKVFKEKLYQLPSSHAIKAYHLLVNHLDSHYQKPVVFENTSSIRYIVSMIEVEPCVCLLPVMFL
jgi:cobalamin biosynthesis Co2+ chelatase CbiK